MGHRYLPSRTALPEEREEGGCFSTSVSPSPNNVIRLLFFIHGGDALHKEDFRQGKAGRVSKLVAGGGGGLGDRVIY